uniref:F-box domain-containing protein n=1 Tax=Bionectria ochroleuca TaxID=29856 RepID=A0A8H7N4I6_BIOOC
MALLNDIPIEIIQQIFNLLPKADLASLCLTNHSNRRHAEPCLYSTINFRWSTSEKPPIILLLRTLLSRPELFALIDTFSLVGNAPRHRMSQDQLRLAMPSNVSLSQFISAIEKTKAPYTDIWVARLETRHMDAFAGLLIAYLSNTTSLTITTNFIRNFHLVGKVLRSKALQFRPPFRFCGRFRF